MNLTEIKNSADPANDLAILLGTLHREGPKDPALLENLSYFKKFFPAVFEKFEEKIISALGLFYKVGDPGNLYSFLMQGFGDQHKEEHGAFLTPVQASIRRAIDDNQYISISAPTSAGKSYSIRDFIAEQKGDAVVVVPSRALIAEYMNAMRRKFAGNKDVMITTFVDLVYKTRPLRRIFVLTPERTKELYKYRDQLPIEVFFFDEAQMSEEKGRGVIFDVSVRRANKHYPAAKIIFAHPFIENPGAQFTKHRLPENQEVSFSHSYTQGAVGKICVFKDKEKFYYFSPYQDNGHLKKNCIELEHSFAEFALNGEHSILIYVSKNSIYNGSFIEGFDAYIAGLPELNDQGALEIIENIRRIVGANTSEHVSNLVNLLKKGVVIHHGSIPLEVRFLIEDFIRNKYSSLCFATSTLAQGINMPFDIVWLKNNRFDGTESERALAFKNLIGRAGRLTPEKIFDYGYVFTSKAKLFSTRIKTQFILTPQSILESVVTGDDENDQRELIEAIQNDTFDDATNIPLSKVERLSQPIVIDAAMRFLDIFYRIPSDLRLSIGGAANKSYRDNAKRLLQTIYEASLGRILYEGEEKVFNQAIDIFFHAAQGRSFSEIVGLRYSSITNRDNPGIPFANFSQPAEKLPNSSLKNSFSLFGLQTPNRAVSYDSIIYDTYDYMDQVISFSLSDVLIAAFMIYRQQTNDNRAARLIELLRYNTNNDVYILLLRYGFPPELIYDIARYVDLIDEDNIVFSTEIANAPVIIKNVVEWYLPNI
ncbi:helicase [Mucilaginibacter sp. PPCGB 2223]|uniref:DEAD/DEAH box helicase n=1 Tax=Mucilaginibacter sp. PPCGB 2223 TaxID=1886027 RepID=UPI0008254F38|nr:DEAD/DEAH box helicase [Mucilaginibacter sp. PPCGB 2223]OCX54283.1 helicase [Mucilaginibacter sp. PPCGB 2223]